MNKLTLKLLNETHVANRENVLPYRCAAFQPMTGEAIAIVRGVDGYYNVDGLDVDEFNEALGITRGQVQAMIMGSMYGWSDPAALPSAYPDHDDPRWVELRATEKELQAAMKLEPSEVEGAVTQLMDNLQDRLMQEDMEAHLDAAEDALIEPDGAVSLSGGDDETLSSLQSLFAGSDVKVIAVDESSFLPGGNLYTGTGDYLCLVSQLSFFAIV